jgi:hypothetical protein
MNIILDKQSQNFLIKNELTEFQIDILSKNNNFLISENQDIFLLSLKKDTRCLVKYDEDIIEFIFDKKIPYLQFITIKFSYDMLISQNENSFEFCVGDDTFIVVFENIAYSVNEDTIIIALKEASGSFKIYDLASNSFAQNFQQQRFHAYNITNPFVIDETSSMPEFSIGTYDDATFTIPRPVRQGNPVISTVPALIDTNSSDDDIEYYNSGNGPDSKTVHFKIICNSILEPLLSADDVSTNLQLKVYLPNGLDTVKSAVYEDMIFVSNDTTNNISVYKSSFTFYKQGRYNNIDYVDGFMYFDVHCPLTVQKSIPFQFDFSL